MIEISEGTARNGDIELPWIRHAVEGGQPLLLVNGLSSPRVSYEDGFVASSTTEVSMSFVSTIVTLVVPPLPTVATS